MPDKIHICFDEGKSDDAQLDLLSLPFKSTYRVLSWTGTANNSLLTQDFNILDVRSKIMVIKSFKVIPYYSSNTIDMYMTDGITTNIETIWVGARIDRIFDIFAGGTTVNMRVNGSPLSLFNAIFPLDIDLQNIYYKFPEKVQDLTLQINSFHMNSIITGVTGQPYVKVNMEVYLI